MEDAPPGSLRLEWIDPANLKANEFNWRSHPPGQVAALKAAIAEVGWAGALLYNEQTGRLIDGHARKGLYEGKGPVPVLVGSWDEAQERLILASLDPIAALAGADAQKLDALLREVSTGDAALQEMLAGLAEDAGITPPDFQPGTLEEQGRLDEKKKCVCPECGHEFTP